MTIPPLGLLYVGGSLKKEGYPVKVFHISSSELGKCVKDIISLDRYYSLNRLIEKNLVRFTVDWFPDKTPQMISMLVLKLKPNIDFDDVQIKKKLQEQYSQKLVFLWAFSNLPILHFRRVKSHKFFTVGNR